MAVAHTTAMNPIEYQFGRFRLIPAARELWKDGSLSHASPLVFDGLVYLLEHRQRMVSRDELVSAVWGKIDVADKQVRQLVARVRQVVDDDAKDPHVIRTVSGGGYRWVMVVETCVGSVDVDAPAGQRSAQPGGSLPPLPISPIEMPSDTSLPSVAVDEGSSEALAGKRGSIRWTTPSIVGLCLLLVVVAFLLYGRREGLPSASKAAAPRRAVAVLPLEVSAAHEGNWVRLGAMDLIAERLRDGGLAVTPSDNVVSAVQAIGEPLDADRSAKLRSALGSSLLVQGIATQSAAGWKVELVAVAADGLRHTSEAERPDVTDAARRSADLLLAALGHAAPDVGERDPSQEELLQQVRAALLANQLDPARAILDGAPDAMKADPQLRYQLAQVDFLSGEFDRSELELKDVLDDPVAAARPLLRAQVLNQLARVAFRRHDCGLASHQAEMAASLLRGQPASVDLGVSLATRALAGICVDEFSIALTDLGQAHAQMEAAGDRLGIARVDNLFGRLEFQRNRPGDAIPYFLAADDILKLFDAPDLLVTNLTDMYYAQSSLLLRSDALVTSDRLWTLLGRIKDPGRSAYVAVIRADALIASGRLHEAGEILAGLDEAHAGPNEEDASAISIARAELDWNEGRYEQAFAEASRALSLFGNAPEPDDAQRAYLALLRQRASIAMGKPIRVQQPDWMTTAKVSSDYLLAAAEWAAREGRESEADSDFLAAAARADATTSPDNIVQVAASYARWLLARGRTEDATAQAGRIALWSDRDFDSALLQVVVFHASMQTTAWAKSLKQAQALAGERQIPSELLAVPAQ
jgi:DNA-binding winged helix-turn-helix (wHTH) protein/tetratricopeptide (TPR) repeat protein